MGLLDNLLNDPATSFYTGLLAAGGPSPRKVGFGQGLAMGLDNHQQARLMEQKRQEAGLMNQYRAMQMKQMESEQAQQEAMRGQINAFRQTLPAEMQALPDNLLMDVWKKKMIPKEPEYKTVGNSLVQIGPKEVKSVFTAQEKVEKTPVEKMLDSMGITDPEQRKKYMQDALTKATTHAPASSATVKLPPMETEENKAYGKWLGETHSNFMQAGMNAPAKLKQLDRMEQLLNGVEGGKLAPAGLEIASMANSFGFKIDPKLGNKEAAQALGNEMAGSYRQPGTGPMTDKDFENFLKRVPDLSKSAEGRKQIMATMRAAYTRDLQASKLARDYRSKNKTIDGFDQVLADFYAKNPVVQTESSGFEIIGQR